MQRDRSNVRWSVTYWVGRGLFTVTCISLMVCHIVIGWIAQLPLFSCLLFSLISTTYYATLFLVVLCLIGR